MPRKTSSELAPGDAVWYYGRVRQVMNAQTVNIISGDRVTVVDLEPLNNGVYPRRDRAYAAPEHPWVIEPSRVILASYARQVVVGDEIDIPGKPIGSWVRVTHAIEETLHGLAGSEEELTVLEVVGGDRFYYRHGAAIRIRREVDQ